MSDRSDDVFRVKPHPPKDADGGSDRCFMARVKMEMNKFGPAARRKVRGNRGRGAKRGRD